MKFNINDERKQHVEFLKQITMCITGVKTSGCLTLLGRTAVSHPGQLFVCFLMSIVLWCDQSLNRSSINNFLKQSKWRQAQLKSRDSFFFHKRLTQNKTPKLIKLTTVIKTIIISKHFKRNS